jgi:hypothetical protein
MKISNTFLESMNVLSVVGLVGLVLQLAAGLLVWRLRLSWQARIEQQRGQRMVDLAVHLRTGGRLREQHADGSVIDLTVTGPDDAQ